MSFYKQLLRPMAIMITLSLPCVLWASDYVELKPEFVLNYGLDDKLHYLKVEVSLRTSEEMAGLDINYHADLLRHEIILEVSKQPVDVITSTEGKQLVQEAVLERLRNVLTQETGKPLVDRVLFVNFIVQR
jgi:flagellar protein FliL